MLSFEEYLKPINDNKGSQPMQSIQHDKKQVQAILETILMPKNMFAITINNPSQKSEVLRFIDTAIRAKQQVTVCVIKH